VTTSLAVHGHFYQPPRENPWTEEVAREPSAAPYHDWNERISAESYRPNAHARILDDAGQALAIVNNYERLSFDAGPTLMAWLERHDPETYAALVSADATGGGVVREPVTIPAGRSTFEVQSTGRAAALAPSDPRTLGVQLVDMTLVPVELCAAAAVLGAQQQEGGCLDTSRAHRT